jgi:hypothetical protein
MTMNAQTDIATPLVKAFAFAWAAIQKRHPDVPDVVITFGGGRKREGLVHGHFAPNRWARGEDHVHELFVGGEGLERGAAAVMGTLLHEATHGLALARDVQDVSRNGRYHNAKFRDLAELMGISVEHSQQLGWSTTTLTEDGAKEYATAIRRLDAAMVAYRRDPLMMVPAGIGGAGGLGGLIGGLPKGYGRKSSNNGLSLECACETPRRIRVSATTAELGPITCGLCKATFS